MSEETETKLTNRGKKSTNSTENDINDKKSQEKSSTLKQQKTPSSSISKSANFLNKQSFLIIFTIRTISVYFNQIWDCDEVYNYWEPLHYILFGNGFQTWEYSPAYSLRSYLYIFLHAVPLAPFVNVVSSKITLFYLLRFVFAVISSSIETYLYQSLSKLAKKQSSVANYFLFFTMTNVGMFLSSTTFLPSTFCMYMCMLAYGAFLRQSYKTSIFAVGLAILLAWPFSLLIGAPILIFICLFKNIENVIDVKDVKISHILKNCLYFIQWTLIFGLIIIVPLVTIDSYMFGKVVVAPLNIVKYNVFPSNPNVGPDIYGREPFSFYILNLVLNFNCLFPLALLSGLLLWFDYLSSKNQANHLARLNQSISTNEMKSNRQLRFVMFCMYLWMAIFFTRPHKEERFLYPIYPLILIGASISLNLIHLKLKALFEHKSNVLKKLVDQIPTTVIMIHCVVSLMRLVALHKNFSSSIEVYKSLNEPVVKFSSPHLESKELINVCVSKEWYRFPSSFFIPEDLTLQTKKQKWRLAFLESDFKGQLPGKFNESLKMPFSTRQVDKSFNDENKEVKSRYLDLNRCDYFIDTDSNRDDQNVQLVFNKKKTNTKWKTLVKYPFLDAGSESNSKTLLKSFYIPYLYEKQIKMTYFKLRLKMP